MKIWVPRTKIIEPREAFNSQQKLAGHFKFEAIKLDGRKRVLADWFPNLILNAGLNRIGANGDFMDYCRVGTGNTTPTNTDTNLVAHVAGTSTSPAQVQSAQGSPPYFGYFRKTFRFGQGAAAGNLAEVGVGWAATDASNLFSRALILDGDGDPTTVTVQSDEFLDVSYELRSYSPDTDVDSTIDISGDSYDITARASNVNSTSWSPSAAAGVTGGTAYNGTIGAVTSAPSGSTGNVSGALSDAYSTDTFYRGYTLTWGLANANLAGGISAIHSSFGMGAMQYAIDPPIPKTNIQTLALNFRQTWARKTL